jgi:hypothetical protein
MPQGVPCECRENHAQQEVPPYLKPKKGHHSGGESTKRAFRIVHRTAVRVSARRCRRRCVRAGDETVVIVVRPEELVIDVPARARNVPSTNHSLTTCLPSDMVHSHHHAQQHRRHDVWAGDRETTQEHGTGTEADEEHGTGTVVKARATTLPDGDDSQQHMPCARSYL